MITVATARDISRQLEPRATAHASAVGKLIDYSQARPNLAQVKAAGFECVFRYVCSDTAEAGLPGKRLTPTERDQILHAGLDIGLHGEDNSTAAQGGYNRGKTQSQQWATYAHDVLAAPKGSVIVAAIDYDTSGTYPSVVQDYLHGVTDGLAGEYATGVYGSYYVVDGAMAARDAAYAVQAVAWSHGNISNRAHVYQHGGTQFPNTDYNDIFIRPYGSWLGGDVAQTLTQDDLDAITKLLIHELNVTSYQSPIDPTKPTHSIVGWLQYNNYRINYDVLNAINSAKTAILNACADDATKLDLTNAVNTIEQAITASQTTLEQAINAITPPGAGTDVPFVGKINPSVTP